MSQENTQLLDYYSDENGSCYLVVNYPIKTGQEQRFVSPAMDPLTLFESIKSIARYPSYNILVFDIKGRHRDICLDRRKIKFGKELESFLIEFAWIQIFANQFELPECIKKKPFDSSLQTPDLLDGL